MLIRKLLFIAILFGLAGILCAQRIGQERPRIIVATDGEADDRASMVRFLLSCNEFDVEGIINSSSQFHWTGGKGWNAFHPVEWVQEYIDLYAQVYPNLKLHDTNYPSPEKLLSTWKVGNISGIGEDSIRTEGAEHIVRVLLDRTDSRPVWIQAWGGCNTLSKALQIIEQEHPERMQEVAARMRLFLIWEQDETYQRYIRPHWEHLQIPTIISDQFDCMAYIWPKVLPEDVKKYFQSPWMKKYILHGHGPLCDAYEHNKGAFNAEGDSPAFLHTIPTGLRNMESPGYGGWGGRFVKVRNNVWMDPLPDSTYSYPTGQWGVHNSWSKRMEHDKSPEKVVIRTNYFRPQWRWFPVIQNDFAARADWCVKTYEEANHHPVVNLKGKTNRVSRSGKHIRLDASKSTDPDGDCLTYRWWHYAEADSYPGNIHIKNDRNARASFVVPADARSGEEIHLICEVTDDGEPKLTRYIRVIVKVK